MSTPEMTEANFLGHVYLATKPCGCLSAMSWDDVGREFAIAEFIAMCVKRGDKISREARYKGEPFLPLNCPAHADSAPAIEPSPAPVQPQAEPLAWMLEIIVNGEKRHQWFYGEKANCLLTARSHGGVCTPLYAGAAPVAQADKLDAERYRWLRDQGALAQPHRSPHFSACTAVLDQMGGDIADGVIDAAMKGTP